MLKLVGGNRVADGNVTATGKVQKKVLGAFLAGENDRNKVQG